MHQIVQRLGFRSRPLGAHSAPRGSLAGKGEGGKEGEGQGGKRKDGREGRLPFLKSLDDVKVKVKVRTLDIAPLRETPPQKHSGTDHTVLPANFTVPASTS